MVVASGAGITLIAIPLRLLLTLPSQQKNLSKNTLSDGRHLAAERGHLLKHPYTHVYATMSTELNDEDLVDYEEARACPTHDD